MSFDFDELKDKAKGAASKVKNVKATLFQTGPKDNLDVKDVYADEPTTTVPSTPDNSKEGKALSTFAKNALGVAKTAVASARADGGEIDVNKTATSADAIARVRAAVGSNASVKGLVAGAFGGSVAGLMGVDSDDPTALATQLGKSGLPGVSRGGKETPEMRMARLMAEDYDKADALIQNHDFESAAGIKNFVDGLGGITGLKAFDIGAEMAFVQGVLDQADKYGVLNLIDNVIKLVKNRDDQKRLLLHNLPMFFARGDLVSINKCMDILGEGTVRANAPNGVNLLMRNYRYKRTIRTADQLQAYLKAQCSLLVQTLGRLNSGWYQMTWNGNTVINQEPYSLASPDTVTVMKFNSMHYQQCILAKQFRKQTFLQVLQLYFPLYRAMLPRAA